MADDQPLKPANILNIVAINQGRRELTRTLPRATPLSPTRVKELLGSDHVLVDARSSAAFGAGHVPGAYNVQLSSSEFEQRVGWVVPPDTPVVLLTEEDHEALEALHHMAFIGLDRQVVGFLEGGVEAWMAAGMPLRTVEQLDVFTLEARIGNGKLQVLDVRDREEWDEGHVAAAEHLPYTAMVPQPGAPARMDTLPFALDQEVAVACAAGNRSSTAISLMLRHGYRNLLNVTGGMEAWASAGLPMLDGEGRPCPVRTP
jgi:hydroxyacylglutathione hydrolase